MFKITTMDKFSHILAFLITAMTAVSCERCVIHGAVADVKGEALPGVSVSANNGEVQALTNAIGEYKLSCKPGPIELSFMKTGYTSGLLEIEATGPREVKTIEVTLWCLPQSAGVYLFENFRYRKLAQIETKPFIEEGKNSKTDPTVSIMYGIGRLPEIAEVVIQKPLLIAFKMPRYDIQLCRLRPVKAKSVEPNPAIQEIWCPEAHVPTATEPIDEPERFLTEIKIFEPLEPGVYAVHWGALEGFTDTDPRTFIFRIFDPEKPAVNNETSEDQQESEEKKKGSD